MKKQPAGFADRLPPIKFGLRSKNRIRINLWHRLFGAFSFFIHYNERVKPTRKAKGEIIEMINKTKGG